MKSIIAAIALVASTSLAQVTTEYRPDPTLIGGTPAPAAEWPASVYARMGNAACSATVIGERVLLIASHCVDNGAAATFSVLSNQYRATCSHTDGYPRNSTYDWTLCLIDRKVTGIEYESLAQTGDGIRVGTALRLTGYGCIRSGGGGGNDGVFRIGTAPVVALPSGTDADITTRGQVALCYGDSGGAVYLEAPDGSRKIVGVNSRGNISTTSYLPAVYHSQFKAKIAAWKVQTGQKICGIDADAPSCRDAVEPEPEPEPNGCADELHAVDEAFSLLKACLQSID
jgi:hypothetical protein